MTRIGTILTICLAVSSLQLYARERLSKREKVYKDLIEYYTKLEEGLFGGRDLGKLMRLEKRADEYARPIIVAVQARYWREMEKQPIGAFEVLAPILMSEDKAEEWLDAYKEAEKKRRAKWMDQKRLAFRERKDPPDEPTGLAIDFPPAAKLKISPNTGECAMEAARCLLELGKVQDALRIIDALGKDFPDLGRVYAFECLGDVQIKMQMYERAVDSYKNGIKLLKSLISADGYSDLQKLIKNRLDEKLADAQKLWDIHRYGPGFVAYREAETKRRKEELYLEAIWIYDKILENFPKTVYAEASKCYKAKCLLELASRKGPGKNEQKTLDRFQKKIDKEEKFYRLARRCKVPEASLNEIKAGIGKYEARLKYLKAIPYGKKALEQAKDIAKAAVKENVYGQYRGEILMDLATYLLETEYDLEGATKYVAQANAWFLKIKEVDATVAAYQLPGQAVEVAAPPPTMKERDMWGNVKWSKLDIGDVINRKTCDWYVDYFIMMSSLKHAFILFVQGKSEEAIPKLDVVLKYDEAERNFHKAGWPNTYARLKAEFQQGRMFATKEDLAHFKGKAKLEIMIADFYYEIEQWDEAARRYREFDIKWRERLDVTARAYLHLMLGFTASATLNRDEALAYFQLFETNRQYQRTPSWPRAMFTLYTIYQSSPKTRLKALTCLKLVAKEREGTTEGDRAFYYQGEFHFAFGNYAEARGIFSICAERYNGTWLARGANQYLALIQNKTEEGAEAK